MNKSDFVDLVAKKAKISRVKAEATVNAIFETVIEGLQKGDRIEIRGFGTFSVREYDGYDGRNPRTGETIRVDPKKLPYFKVSKHLKEAIDSESEF